MKSFKSHALLMLFLFFSFLAYGKEGERVLCETGNLALPPSQQPGPLVSFGQNIIARNHVQLFLFGDDFIGKKKHFIDLVPGILYGLTDHLSLFLNLPIAADYKVEKHSSSGLEDLFLQLEYAIYAKASSCSSHQLTLVANASFPTGSSHKIPSTGFGSMAYFLGTTYNYTGVHWFCFTSYGAELPTSHHGTKFGNAYLYQFGFGRNIANTKDWIFAWVVEMDGIFEERNKIHGSKDPNSGGNTIYATPSLWASSKNWIAQLGFGGAVQQHLFGEQKKDHFLLVFNLGRTF